MTQSKIPALPADDTADLLGETRSSTGDSFVSALGFNGERRSNLLGGYHLGNGYRVYNPALRRFNSPDSMSPFGAGGINPYAYCAGDPINRTDPTGHVSFDPLDEDMALQPFRSGDLLYGLGTVRGKYFTDYKENFSFANMYMYPCTIDQYSSNPEERRMRDVIAKFSVGEDNPPVAYHDNEERFHKSINKHEKYSSILTDNKMDYDLRVKRKCKAGLNWSLEDYGRVHFVLDDVIEEDVINKKLYGPSGYEQKGFTGSELRWLYRNRENEKFHHRILFFREGKRVAPPWETNPKLWGQLDENKRLKQSSNSMTEQSTSRAVHTARGASSVGEADSALETDFEFFDFFELFLL